MNFLAMKCFYENVRIYSKMFEEIRKYSKKFGIKNVAFGMATPYRG